MQTVGNTLSASAGSFPPKCTVIVAVTAPKGCRQTVGVTLFCPQLFANYLLRAGANVARTELCFVAGTNCLKYLHFRYVINS